MDSGDEMELGNAGAGLVQRDMSALKPDGAWTKAGAPFPREAEQASPFKWVVQKQAIMMRVLGSSDAI